MQDVDTEHLVGGAAAQNLDKTLSVLVGARSGVGAEGEDTLLGALGKTRPKVVVFLVR